MVKPVKATHSSSLVKEAQRQRRPRKKRTLLLDEQNYERFEELLSRTENPRVFPSTIVDLFIDKYLKENE